MRERIARVIAKQTGKPYDTVIIDIERDHWMNAQEAIAYGIVFKVIEHQARVELIASRSVAVASGPASKAGV